MKKIVAKKQTDEKPGFLEKLRRQNEKCLNCHCEGGLSRVKLLVNHYDPPWQSFWEAKGKRQEARGEEGFIAIPKKVTKNPETPTCCLLHACLLPSPTRLLLCEKASPTADLTIFPRG